MQPVFVCEGLDLDGKHWIRVAVGDKDLTILMSIFVGLKMAHWRSGRPSEPHKGYFVVWEM